MSVIGSQLKDWSNIDTSSNQSEFEKIINELKWQPKYNFHEGIELTVKWYLNNTQWLNQFF